MSFIDDFKKIFSINKINNLGTYTINKPETLISITTKIGDYEFNLPKHMYFIKENINMSCDMFYIISFSENDIHNLNKSIICIQDDFIIRNSNIFNINEFTITNSDIFINKLIYNKIDEINNIKKDCIAYKFLYGGCYKLLTLEIPEECFIDEINYSKIALELIASTFKII
jgi:hypothetical protein